jgi:IS5 family transposase
MRQQTLAEEGFERFRKPTRRDQFLAEMEQIIPWRDLCKVIKPFYPKPKGVPPTDRAGAHVAHSFSATLV